MVFEHNKKERVLFLEQIKKIICMGWGEGFAMFPLSPFIFYQLLFFGICS
jgi:hypothetical protein